MWSLFWPLLNCTRFLPLFLSRVQRFEFKSIKTQDIKEHIHYILEKKISVLNQRLWKSLLERAEGGMRDALSILDQAPV